MSEILEFFQNLWEILGKIAPYLWIGNLFSLLAMGTDALSSTRKTARGVLRIFYYARRLCFQTGIGISCHGVHGGRMRFPQFGIFRQRKRRGGYGGLYCKAQA